MNNVALIILYNHRYDKNIPVLEHLYHSRFSHIYHLVPFYDGDKPNVIPVYGNSRRFQAYINQAYKALLPLKYEHYMFVADDLYLNPSINETNYLDIFKLKEGYSFIPEFRELHKVQKWWPRTQEAYLFSLKVDGVELGNELPSYDEAIQLYKQNNIDFQPLLARHAFRRLSETRGGKTFTRWLWSKLRYFHKRRFNIEYPLVGAYSDIICIHKDCLPKFSHYCGIFDATELFVELAIPSALALSTDKIITEEKMDLKGRPLWTKKDLEELNKYHYDLDELNENFPAEILYYHPVKLSTWKKN